MSRKLSVLIAGLLFALLPVAPALAAAPTVTGVASPTTPGSYKFGSPVIEIRVQFSEIVNVTGIPTLELETGTTDRILNYSSGSGTNTLKFNYTISITTSNDTSTDLDYTAAATLVLAGGSTIQNAGLENAVLTLPAPGTAGSLGANNAIMIDTTAPTASVTTITIGPNGTGVTLNAVAQSNSLGTAYLVSTTVTVTDEASITTASANLRSSVTPISAINTNTNISASGLGNGTFKVYTLDAAKNVSAASTNTVTVDAVGPNVGMVPLNTPLGNASRISVQSSEAGTAYLVRSTVTVTNKASILTAQTANTADVNEVIIGAPNINTALATTTLNPGNFILYAVDAYDNLSFPFPFPITIGTDTSAPTMLGPTPFNGDLEAGVAANIVLRFNEPVAKYVVDSTKTITLARSLVPTITTGSLTGNVVTLTFSSNPGLVLTNKITTTNCSNAIFNEPASAITVVSGNTISFAKTNADIASAAITGCTYTATKTDGITNLITVSEIIPSDNAIVTVGAFPTDDTVTINPAGEMLFGVSYYVLITAGAIVDKASRDFSGIPSASPQFYSFTTGNDTTRPTLIGGQSDPPNGMTTFTPDRSITLKFSETVIAVADKFIKLCTGALNCATPVQTFT